jgi:mediator of RNA polymerase II transcription subunit 13
LRTMTTRTFHPLPKRPTFASVPASSGSSSQRHGHSHQHGHAGQSTGARGPSVTVSTPPAQMTTPTTTPTAVTPTPTPTPGPAAAPAPQTGVQSQQTPLKPIPLPPQLTESSSLLGAQIQLDTNYHISCTTYSGSTLACERLRQHIISTWSDNTPTLEPYLFDHGQIEGQITVYKYEDILCDSEDFAQLGMNLGESNWRDRLGRLSTD